MSFSETVINLWIEGYLQALKEKTHKNSALDADLAITALKERFLSKYEDRTEYGKSNEFIRNFDEH